MILTNINQQLNGQFLLSLNEKELNWDKINNDKLIHILWNRSKQDIAFEIDDYTYVMPSESILTTTYYHKIKGLKDTSSLAVFSFNREYYCIYDHDEEVSCNGIIFFGAKQQLVIKLDDEYRKKLEILLQVFIEEFSYKDKIQGDMLVMLLKRLIILCTRLAKKQEGMVTWKNEEVDIFRKFNYMVDMNFRVLKTVKEYADLLHKSPKTLSNFFSKIGEKTPLQIIHERIVLEAKRLLTYTDKSVSEIAFDLGFEEPATFFKMFKKLMNDTPQNFRSTKKILKRKFRHSVGNSCLCLSSLSTLLLYCK